MSRAMWIRLSVAEFLTAVLLSSTPAQSQDSQSVAEAARRAKQQKKPPAKPARVITEEDVKTLMPGADAAAAPAAAPDAGAATQASTGAPAPAAANAATDASKAGDKKEPKEVTELREQIKQAQSNLELQQRQLRLDSEAVYSKTGYESDTAGLAKLDAQKQQIGQKQQEIENLKAKLAGLLKSLNLEDASAPPKP